MTLRLSVIGTGYLGATHAACMAELGFEVIGYDVDEAKIAALREGQAPFFEPGLPELLTKQVESGRLTFTTDLPEVAAFADVHFVCVGTPQLQGSFAADMRYVRSVIESLGPLLDRECLVVGKSTVPSGTAAELAKRLAALAPGGDLVELAWNPEFLREGFAVKDTLRPERLVIGVTSARAEKVLREVYAPLTDLEIPLIVTDFATAELVKVAANSFLATKISFINAMAEICETTGADVVQLAQWRQPGVEQALHQRLVNVFLAAEVIEEVRLRHAGGFGDLIDGRTAKAVGGEDFERGFEDQLALFLLDAGAAGSGAFHRVRHPCKLQRRPSGPIVWTSFSLGCGARFLCRISASNPFDRRQAVLTFVQPVKILRSTKAQQRPSVGRTETGYKGKSWSCPTG